MLDTIVNKEVKTNAPQYDYRETIVASQRVNWNIEDKNDKTLELVDREVMVRSIDIYNEMKLETPVK